TNSATPARAARTVKEKPRTAGNRRRGIIEQFRFTVDDLRFTTFGVEATGGFEPPNKGFADLSLNHLGTSPEPRPDSTAAAPPPIDAPHRGTVSPFVILERESSSAAPRLQRAPCA